jgi:Family of unknown function (DUF6074)
MRSAEVIPFPAVRRKAFLAKNGRHAAEYRPQAAFRYIDGLVDRHRQRLQRLGVEPAIAEADAAALTAALHAELCRLRMCDGGAV